MPQNKSEYDRRYYTSRTATQKRRMFDVKNTRRRKIVAAVREYKAQRGCSRCPERDARCLDFHHRDRLTKTLTIGDAITKGWSLTRLMTEIAKCDVLCANCHRKETFGNKIR